MILLSDTPTRARIAIVLLWASVLPMFFRTVVGNLLSDKSAIGALAILAIYGVVVFFASRREGWARKALLAWTVLAAASYFLYFKTHPHPLWLKLVAVAGFGAQLVAVQLLFAGDEVNEWYEPPGSA